MKFGKDPKFMADDYVSEEEEEIPEVLQNGANGNEHSHRSSCKYLPTCRTYLNKAISN